MHLNITAGGIGITTLQLFSANPNLIKVRLVWMTKKNDFTWNMVIADNLMNKEDKQIFSIAIYITSESKEIALDRGSSPIHTVSYSYSFYDQTEIHFRRASFDFLKGYNKTLVYAVVLR